MLLERLELAGSPLPYLPPGEAFDLKPIFVGGEVSTISGSIYVRGPLSGYVMTISPSESFAIPLELKLILAAAHASSTSITLLETYTNPGVVTTWGAFVTEFTAKEIAGSERQLYTYSITLRLGA